MDFGFLNMVRNEDIVSKYIKVFTSTGEFSTFYKFTAILDFIIIVGIIYLVVKEIKNTRVLQLLKGIALLLLINYLSYVFKMPIINTILSSLMIYGTLLIVILFQPEIRKMLEQLGTSSLTQYLGIQDIQNKNTKMKEVIYKVSLACNELAKTKTGALIVLEKDIKIQEIITSGIAINADVSVQLLRNIFVSNTPLHDGAVVISGNKIRSACSILPLADDEINKSFGTRHRAALGISKNSDAVAVVVSEETGKISVAKGGTLIVDLKEEVLRKVLIKALVKQENKNVSKAKDIFSFKMFKKD